MDRNLRALLRTQRILILLIARDFITAHKILSRLAHQEAGERIKKTVAVHSVNEFHVAHPHSPTRALGIVWNARHAFSSTSENNTRASEHNLLRGENDRFQTGAARLIDRVGWNCLRHTRAINNLSRDVRPAASLTRRTPD